MDHPIPTTHTLPIFAKANKISKAQNIRRCCAPDELDTTPPLWGCRCYAAKIRLQNFSFFVCIFLYLLALIHLNEKLRFNFSFISLHVNYLSFNSLIFRSTKKFVTSFVSIGSEVTTFFDFLKFAFCRCCYVASASLPPVKSLIGPKTNQQQATNPLRHSWQTETDF